MIKEPRGLLAEFSNLFQPLEMEENELDWSVAEFGAEDGTAAEAVLGATAEALCKGKFKHLWGG